MHGFWIEILAFPTVLYTGLLGLASLYWLMVILGTLDMDLIHVDGAAEGAVEGAVEGAMEGAAEGAAEGAMESAAHAAADGALDGAAEGADAGHEGHGLPWLGWVLTSLGLRAVPFTFILSLIVLWSWMLSFTAMHLLRGVWPFPEWVLGSLVLPGSFLGALPLTALCVRPLVGFFRTPEGPSKLVLIGKSCRISTNSVDERFGQATVEDGGAGLILQVRHGQGGRLRKGDLAVLVDYDPARDAYLVEPVDGEPDDAPPLPDARGRPERAGPVS